MSRDPGRLTFAEFLAYEAAQEQAHELVDGIIVARPASSLRHAAVVANVLALLRAQVTAPSFVFGSDAPVRTRRGLRRADALVVHAPEFALAEVRSPQLIVEIVSEETAVVDLTDKLTDYTNIDSLQEYLLVDSRFAWAHVVRRQGHDWVRVIPHLSGTVHLETLEMRIPFDAVYDGIGFEPQQ